MNGYLRIIRWKYAQPDEKGLEFERFCKRFIGSEFDVQEKKKQEYIGENNIQSYCIPDFTLKNLQYETEDPNIYLECKYNFSTFRRDQFDFYRSEMANKMIFVITCEGGTPKSPDHIFLFPFYKMNGPSSYPSDIWDYEIRRRSRFTQEDFERTYRKNSLFAFDDSW